MNVAILGIELASRTVVQIIENDYNTWLKSKIAEPINVVAYMSLRKDDHSIIDNKAVLNYDQFLALHRNKVIDKIIFPRETYFEVQKQMLTLLRTDHVSMEDVIIANRLNENIYLENFIELYPTVRYLPHIEFRIAEQCNLNCKMCTEYCALVKEPTFYPLDKFTRDFTRLREFIDDFAAIRILGGEPLLNPQVGEFVKVCRKLYPVSPIHVVTNAILLPKMSDDFFDTIRECNAVIWISFYPPMESKMPAIAQLLKKKNVSHLISQKIETFFRRQTLRRNNHPEKMFERCFFSNCHNLCDGKIAACFLPFVTKYFNAYYGKNLPEDGALDLYDASLTTKKLKAFLLKPIERCNYCSKSVNLKWEVTSHPSPITDWIND